MDRYFMEVPVAAPSAGDRSKIGAARTYSTIGRVSSEGMRFIKTRIAAGSDPGESLPAAWVASLGSVYWHPANAWAPGDPRLAGDVVARVQEMVWLNCRQPTAKEEGDARSLR